MTHVNPDGRRPIWLMSNAQEFRPEVIELRPQWPPYIEFVFAYDGDFHKSLIDHFKDGLTFMVQPDPDRAPVEPVRCRVHQLNAPLIETPSMVGGFASFGPINVVVELLDDVPLN